MPLAPSLEATTPANLLSRKQGLIERLHEHPGPHERNEIERLLADIDQALDVFDQGGPGQKRTLPGRDAYCAQNSSSPAARSSD